MAESQAKTSAQGFTKKQSSMITLGSVLLIFFIAASGMSLGFIQGPMLEKINAIDMFSLITTISTVALCIMTPIGGRLVDIYGVRKVILYGGALCLITNLILPFASNKFLFLIVRFLMSLGMGAFVTAPYLMAPMVVAPKDVPKIMGYLTISLAVGSLAGSYFSNILSANGMLTIGVLWPAIFLVASMALCLPNLPQQPKSATVKLDVKGVILLSLTLIFICIPLTFAPSMGFGNPMIWGGLVLGIICLVLFIMVEKKVSSPLIPMYLFKNKEYTMLLVITFLSVFYMTAMNSYLPQAMRQITHTEESVIGIFQLPRTIVQLILPSFIGIWLTKNIAKRTATSLSITGICLGVCFTFLVWFGVHMPVWFVIVCITLTGIADSFRAVSTTPAAQQLLTKADIGIGTSLVGFAISLSNVISACVDGFAWDSLRLAHEGIGGLTEGADTIFLIAAVTGYLTFILAFFVYRVMVNKRNKAAEK
ncbi:MFS transporter [Allobaculum sp. JKK-2023]|uniref:MFS transporter n=1 Tax=Allobaculum sp. JKK-2023 TaxID=3108943 RepID=UPI002B05E77B|nr:MFS transporter [Allobaculum sp. JKK-2023]